MQRILSILAILIFTATSIALYASEADAITEAHNKKINAIKKRHSEEIAKIKAKTIKRYEALKRRLTREGKLNEAVEIQNKIHALESNDLDKVTSKENADEDIAEAEGVGIPEGPPIIERAKTKRLKKKISKRVLAFNTEVAKNRIEKAIGYIDPVIVRHAGKDIVAGHIQILAGVYKIHGITSRRNIGISKIYFDNVKKHAKVVVKVRVNQMQWHDMDDHQYWLKRRGKWFLGDDKTLKNKIYKEE